MSKTDNRERWNRTGAEIAAMFGVSAEAISNWVQAGAPKIAHNQYDERVFVPWVIDQYRSRDKATLAEEQTRLTKHKADIAEMEAAEKRGELVKTDSVREWWQRVSSVIRSRFLSLPSITPQVLAAPTVQESQKVVEDAVWNILNELSTSEPVPAVVPVAAAPPDGERVGRPKARAVRRVKRRARKMEHVES